MSLPTTMPSLLRLISPHEAPIIWYFFRERIDRGSNYSELATRCLAALRPGVDFIVLPRENKLVAASVACLKAQEQQFSETQIIWVAVPELVDDNICHDKCLEQVFQHMRSIQKIDFASTKPEDIPSLVPYVVTPRFIKLFEMSQASSTCCKLNLFGDPVHTTVTKAWLHPRPQEGSTPMMRKSGVRVARGYSCMSQREIVRAYYLLRRDGVSQMLFKPSFAQSGMGITVIHSVDDIQRLPLDALQDKLGDDQTMMEYGFATAGKSRKNQQRHESPPFILEERLESCVHLPSPCMQSLGKQLLPVCDQLMEGQHQEKHAGNAFPPRLPYHISMKCSAAFAKLAQLPSFANLHGFWGIDVVISSEDEEPVVVDLNMARPNGNHFPLILAERLRKDAAEEFAWVMRKVPCPDCDPTRLVNELRQAGMLTDEQGYGVRIMSFVPGGKGKIFVSGASREQAEKMATRCMAILVAKQSPCKQMNSAQTAHGTLHLQKMLPNFLTRVGIYIIIAVAVVCITVVTGF